MTLDEAKTLYSQPLPSTRASALLAQTERLIKDACENGDSVCNIAFNTSKELTAVFKHYSALGFKVDSFSPGLNLSISGWGGTTEID